MAYDLVIKNGTVIDGTRMPRFRADVGIANGRVAKIGRIDNVGSARVIDAKGCFVVPGFVDLHTHYDAQIHWDPYCTVSGWHGVTSVVLGNCGFGFAPVRPAERDRSMLMMTRTEQVAFDTMKEGMTWRWETFPEWMENLKSIPKGVNVITYTPLTPLMIYVMGLEAAKSRPATPAERKEMQRLLHESMDVGSCGFSFQHLGKYTNQPDFDGTPMPTDIMADEDIFALCEVLRERDQGVIQLTQASGGNPFDSDPERDHKFLEKLAEISGRPIIHNAIAVPASNDTTWSDKELAWLHDANARGLRIFAQGQGSRQFQEFTLEYYNFYDSSPAWNYATHGTIEEKMEKMRDPDVRKRMREEQHLLEVQGIHGMPAGLTIMSVPGRFPDLQKYVGRVVGDIAKEQGKHPNDMMLDIALAGDLQVKFRIKYVTSDNAQLVGPLMADPYVIAGLSDGGAHTKYLVGGSYTTEMLTWLVRDNNTMLLEEMHYHLSYLPAHAAGFLDRGYLREGAPADIVVYNLDELKRIPEWEYEIVRDLPAGDWRCVQRAQGYRWTIVNGEITFENGKCTGKTPGMLLVGGKTPVSTPKMAAE